MGYTTIFTGQFQLDRPLSRELRHYLNSFSESRRMKRNDHVHTLDPDAVYGFTAYVNGFERKTLGEQGEYYANPDNEEMGAVADYNQPPDGQPGLWCDWAPNPDGTAICWNGSDKTYDSIEWLEYLIEHFLKPHGHTLNGVVDAQGEYDHDRYEIMIHDNAVVKINM